MEDNTCIIGKIFKNEIDEFLRQTVYEIEQRNKGIETEIMKKHKAIENIPFILIPSFSMGECIQIWDEQ